MLYEFINTYSERIITRTREKLIARSLPLASDNELENGVPLFLKQLSETLKSENTESPFPPMEIGYSATRHGSELLGLGFTVSQVVHDYGDICQAITEIAIEQNAPITTEEFHTLNRCLDTAIAEAVTEYARMTAKTTSTEEIERLGHVAHEIRDRLNSVLFAFDALKRGVVAINGSTGKLLGRSLTGLHDFVQSTLSDVRMMANLQRSERVQVASFVNDIALTTGLHAESRGVQFSVELDDPQMAVNADPQLLGSAVTNLLNNAFKYTRTGGKVVLRARRRDSQLLFEVEDECGGIPDSIGDLFQPFGERHGADRTGLGLGLSIARKAVRAHRGEIHVHNMPGKGCIFTIELPLAAEEVPVSAETYIANA